MAGFIPHFHFKPSKEKLTREWCNEVVQFYIYQSHLQGLLDGKEVDEIDGYADGTYSMKPFKRMFKSLRDQMNKDGQAGYSKEALAKLDKTGINWERVPLIAPKLNSAIAITQKIPIEVTCTCTDPLAQRKKKEDLEYLRNKPMMEDLLQPLYDSMNLGPVDLGPTKYSSIPYTSLPLDLDAEDEQEFMLFANLIYNLAPEAAFETILNLYTDTKRVKNVKLMETKDQYRYAVSANQVIRDKMTGLPNLEYQYPGSIYTDGSMLPDFSDNAVRLIHKRITPMELFKYFPDEICDEQHLEKIVGTDGSKASWDAGYCACNNRSTKLDRSDWNTFKMDLEYIEVKSVDSVMVGTKTTKRGSYEYFTTEPEKCTGKVWGQNTYCFYWLRNTKYFFGIDKLPYAYRAKGKEKYQSFSTNIYKSNEKSAVELSIGENKKAQMADIKLQHNIIMSMPDGKVIDMKYIRNAIEGLTEDAGPEGAQYTSDDLLNKAMEFNIHIIDTDGFEGKQNAGQYMPVTKLPGGLGASLEGYYRVMIEADAKISMYTNINQQLTGQSPNPEGLVGLQKLLINSSLNGLYYVNEGLECNYQMAYTLMANCIKEGIEDGGSVRKAIEAIIGTNKAEIIDKMDDVALHEIGVVIKLGQREEERAQFQMQINEMHKIGKIDTAAKYYILNTPNPKDSFLLAAMFERKYNKKQDEKFAAQLQNQQEMVKQQGENALQTTQAQTEGSIAEIGAKGKVEADLMKLGAQLGLSQTQIEGLVKRQLQADRANQQVDKSLKTLYAKNNLEAQQPLQA